MNERPEIHTDPVATRARNSRSYSYLPGGKSYGYRATRAEVDEAIADAPAPRAPYSNDPAFLEALANVYHRVTGRSVDRITYPMRKLLAACYRVHGDDLEPLLRRLVADGGETNLLLRARTTVPREESRLTIVQTETPQSPPASENARDPLDFSDLLPDIDRELIGPHIDCREYEAHAKPSLELHRRIGADWVCLACHPEAKVA